MKLTKEMLEILLEIKEKGSKFNTDSHTTKTVNKLEQMGLVATTAIHGLKEPWTCMITEKGKETLKQEGVI